jgi:peptidoglycan/LPS O-acetylase OafA/YrhL
MEYIDGLRAIAAIMVILDHVYFQVFPYSFDRVPHTALAHATRFFVAGHLGVPVFLVISGYCLMLPVVRNAGALPGGYARFIRRRARRILPPYYAAAALCLALNAFVINMHTGGQYDTAAPVTTRGLLAHLFMLQDYIDVRQINAVFWTLAVEWKIYFLFPLFLLGWRKIGPWATLGIAAVVGMALLRVVGHHFDRACPHFIALFVAGMIGATIAYDAAPRWRNWRARLPWPLFAVLSMAALAGLACWKGAAHLNDYRADVAAAVITLCTLIAASRPGALARILSWRPLVAVGVFSYSVYMMHVPFMQILWQAFLLPHRAQLGSDMMEVLTLAVIVPAVVAMSYAFFLVCERPFLNSRSSRNRESGGQQPPAVGAPR